jgi:hypothetical protein
MRLQRSTWPAWLALALGVLGGTFSLLGIIMVGSFHVARPHAQYRTAAWIYSGALAVATLIALGAGIFLIRAYRKPTTARDRDIP